MKKLYVIFIVVIVAVSVLTSCTPDINTVTHDDVESSEKITGIDYDVSETEDVSITEETDTETAAIETESETETETDITIETESEEDMTNQFSLETKEVITPVTSEQVEEQTNATEVNAKLKDAIKSLKVRTKTNASLICFRPEEEIEKAYSVITFVNNSDGSSSQKNTYRFYENREDYLRAAEDAGVDTESEFGKYNLIMISSEIDESIGDPNENFDVLMGGYEVFYG